MNKIPEKKYSADIGMVKSKNTKLKTRKNKGVYPMKGGSKIKYIEVSLYNRRGEKVNLKARYSPEQIENIKYLIYTFLNPILNLVNNPTHFYTVDSIKVNTTDDFNTDGEFDGLIIECNKISGEEDDFPDSFITEYLNGEIFSLLVDPNSLLSILHNDIDPINNSSYIYISFNSHIDNDLNAQMAKMQRRLHRK